MLMYNAIEVFNSYIFELQKKEKIFHSQMFHLHLQYLFSLSYLHNNVQGSELCRTLWHSCFSSD